MAKSNKAITQADERRASLKIGEVAELSGVGIEALRFYERSGLLGRPARTNSGYRMYDPAVIDRLAFIKRAQVLGFSLDEIKQIIAEKELGRNPCAEVREVVRHRLRELDERMAQMRRYRKDLQTALNEWDKAGAMEGDVCGLIEGTDIEHPLDAHSGLKKRRTGKK